MLYKNINLKQYPSPYDALKLYIPEKLRKSVLEECHDSVNAGNFGIRKTLFRLKQKYYWPNMLRDTKDYVNSCDTCAKVKVPQLKSLGEMGQHRKVTRPWQVVSLDWMGPFPKSKKCNTMLLVITCWFSKFALLFPLRTGKADKICEILENQILLFGRFDTVICDNGKQFVSEVFQELAKKYNYSIWYTPNYHPQSNPTERVNRVVGTTIAAYIKSSKHNEWDVNLQQVGHAIRTAVHESTGYTPSYLIFGREASLTGLGFLEITDLAEPLSGDPSDFVQQLQDGDIVYKEVSRNMEKAYKKSLVVYNSKHRQSHFKIGDVVWKRTKFLSKAKLKFMTKLAPKYEKAIITEVLSDNIYRLESMLGKHLGVWHAKDLKPSC